MIFFSSFFIFFSFFFPLRSHSIRRPWVPPWPSGKGRQVYPPGGTPASSKTTLRVPYVTVRFFRGPIRCPVAGGHSVVLLCDLAFPRQKAVCKTGRETPNTPQTSPNDHPAGRAGGALKM